MHAQNMETLTTFAGVSEPLRRQPVETGLRIEPVTVHRAELLAAALASVPKVCLCCHDSGTAP